MSHLKIDKDLLKRFERCLDPRNPEKNEVTCSNYMVKKDFKKYLEDRMSFLEQNPQYYTKIIKELIIE